MTSPGKPAPVPKSSHGPDVSRGTRQSSCALSAMCRRQTSARLEAETEILPPVFLGKQFGEAFQPRHGLVVALRQSPEPVPRLAFVGDHAASRRAWTSSAASAAGVTPGTRPAAASVAGRDAVSRSTISRERPAISA